MNEESRLEQYLHQQADTVSLSPREPSTVAAHARQRRHARRTMGAFTAAAIVLVGAFVVVAHGTSSQSVDLLGSQTVASKLDWTTVDAPQGLGWATDTVTASDGSIYGLSTAPGPQDPNASTSPASALYSSTDGETWSQARLPDGIRTTGLAAASGHLYAVGTAPAGGGTDVVVAASADGAKTWTQAHLPAPDAALKARFGNQIVLSAATVASGPHGLVATVSVTAQPDVQALLATVGVTGNTAWTTTATGVDVLGTGELANPSVDKTCAGGATTATTVAPANDPATTALDARACQQAMATVVASYTWDQLGLDPDLKALLGGQVHVYTSADGSSFAEVPSAGIEAGRVVALVGSDDGYRMLAEDPSPPSREGDPSMSQLYSTDGRSWASSGPAIEGWVQTAGLLAGTPAAVAQTSGGVRLLLAVPGGAWTSTDIAPTGTGGSATRPGYGIESASIGPLGLVVALSSTDAVDNDTFVVESSDGHHFATERLSNLAGPGSWLVTGSAMNADAVTLRLASLPAAERKPGAAPGPQHLLVGTPR